MLDAIYRQFGEPADWGEDDPVRTVVRRIEGDEEVQIGRSRAILGSVMLYLRKDSGIEPVEGDALAVLDEITFAVVARYRLVAEPRLGRFGLEWLCEAKEIPA